MSAFFADRPSSHAQAIDIAPLSCQHLRTSDSLNLGGLVIPVGVPYGLMLESDVLLGIQYSRLDVSVGYTLIGYTLMTTAVVAVVDS